MAPCPATPIPARKYRQILYQAHREKNDKEKGKTVAVIAVSARGKDGEDRKINGLLYYTCGVCLLEIIRNYKIIAKTAINFFRLAETEKTKNNDSERLMFTIIHTIPRLSPAAVFGSSASYGARQRRHLEPVSPREDDWSSAAAPSRGSGLVAISPPRAAVRFDGDSHLAADSPKLFQPGGMVIVTGSLSPSAIRSSSPASQHHHHHYQQQRATASFHHSRQQQHPSTAVYDNDEDHNNGDDSSHVVDNSNNRSSSHNNSGSSNNLPEDLSMGGKEDVEGTGGGRHQRASIEH